MRTNSLIRIVIVLMVLTIIPGFSQSLEETVNELNFRHVGPNRGGRSTAVTGDAQNKGTFFMGTTGGGLWKSTDYGTTWKNVSDGYFATGSIGAVRIAPTNSNMVYVGTGSDGIRSNIITGKGVYKSTDGGKSWRHMGLKMSGHIGAVEVHPNNEDVVFVAAIGQAHSPNSERGLFRSQDGGNSWEKVLFVSDSIGIVDVEFAPGNPNVMYAAAWQVNRKPWTIKSGPKGGIYKSTNGGSTWVKLSNGLPTGIVGKADLAVSTDDPNRVYALIEALPSQGGLYRSDDQGENFRLVSTHKPLLDRPFYYCNVDANPQNADAVYVNSTRFWQSFDGGESWGRIRTPHGDNHDMWFHPQDSNLYIQSNDGGANVTHNYGKTWSTQFNQPTSELYQVEVDDQYPYWLYAGRQDDGVAISVPSAPSYSPLEGPNGYMMAVGGCETGPAVPKPGNHNIVYNNCKGRFSVYDKRTGQEKQYYVGAANMYGHNPKELRYRFQRVSPVHVSPHNPNVVYHASQYVHRTKDDGVTWETISPDLTAYEDDKQVISGNPITRDVTGEEFYSTIYSLRESTISPGLLWVGANDGPVHTSRDSGGKWVDVTPKKAPKGGRVDSVEPSPHNPAKAYVSILRYQLGDWKPYVFKTENYGKSWELLTDGTNGIPDDYPVRVVREDPEREGLLYAGTEFGLFISENDGKSWQPFQINLPVTPVTDIKLYRDDLAISTMGRGFWIMDNRHVIHEALSIDKSQSAFFKPKNTIGYRYRGGSMDNISYPSPGVPFSYYLAAKSDIKLEIMDYRGKVVRVIESKPSDNEDAPERSMATGFFGFGAAASLKNDPGLHVYSWDMRNRGPWHQNKSRSGVGGPMVTPGNFTARMTIDGKVKEYTFDITLDPNMEKTGITKGELQAQENLSLQIRDLQSEVRFMSYHVSERVKEFEKDGKKVRGILKELNDILNTEEGRYMTPKLNDQVSYLNSMLNRTYQRPGKDAVERYEELRDIAFGLRDKFEKEFELNSMDVLEE